MSYFSSTEPSQLTLVRGTSEGLQAFRSGRAAYIPDQEKIRRRLRNSNPQVSGGVGPCSTRRTAIAARTPYPWCHDTDP
jgi:hypothetical protein